MKKQQTVAAAVVAPLLLLQVQCFTRAPDALETSGAEEQFFFGKGEQAKRASCRTAISLPMAERVSSEKDPTDSAPPGGTNATPLVYGLPAPRRDPKHPERVETLKTVMVEVALKTAKGNVEIDSDTVELFTTQESVFGNTTSARKKLKMRGKIAPVRRWNMLGSDWIGFRGKVWEPAESKERRPFDYHLDLVARRRGGDRPWTLLMMLSWKDGKGKKHDIYREFTCTGEGTGVLANRGGQSGLPAVLRDGSDTLRSSVNLQVYNNLRRFGSADSGKEGEVVYKVADVWQEFREYLKTNRIPGNRGFDSRWDYCQYTWEEQPGYADYTGKHNFFTSRGLEIGPLDRAHDKTLQGAGALDGGLCENARIVAPCFRLVSRWDVDLRPGLVSWAQDQGLNLVQVKLAIAMQETKIGQLADSCSGGSCNGIGITQIITAYPNDERDETLGLDDVRWRGVNHNLLTNLNYQSRILYEKTYIAEDLDGEANLVNVARRYNGNPDSSIRLPYGPKVQGYYADLAACQPALDFSFEDMKP